MVGSVIMTTSKDALLPSVVSKTTVGETRSAGGLRRGYLILVLSVASFSANGILLKTALVHFDSSLIPFWRVLIVVLAGIALAAYQPRALRIDTRHVPLFAVLGIVGIGLQQILWTLSVLWNGVAIATVLVSIAPAVVALLAWRFLGESFGYPKLVALLLSTIGVALISRVYEIGTLNFNGLGILVGVGTGVAWASYSVLGRFGALRYSAWTVTFYAFGFAALFLLLYRVLSAVVVNSSLAGAAESALGLALLFPSVELQWWLLLALMALGPTLGGFALYTMGLSHVPASVASLIGMLEPVLSIILAFFIFGESLNPIQVIGATLILASVLVLSTRTGKSTGQKQT